jgi:Spy/CpxP family protein refolding chaperone
VNAWKIILATMVIFGTGVITGGLLVRHSQRVWPRQIIQHQAPARPVTSGNFGGSRLEFLRRAERELHLSAQQRQQVEEILRNSQERIKKLMDDVSPAVKDEVQRAREEFRSILTPDQRERMDDLLKQQRARDPRRNQGHREKTAGTNTSARGDRTISAQTIER